MDDYLERHHAELVARNNMLNNLYHQTPTELLGLKIPSKLPPADPFKNPLKVEPGIVELEMQAWAEEAKAYEEQVRVHKETLQKN